MRCFWQPLLRPVLALIRANRSRHPRSLTDPSNYDGESVTVSGTVKNPTARQTRRGTATAYQLCDNDCINVIDFGNTNVSDGSQVTVSGRFRASFGRQQTMTNVLLVGGHRGGEPAASTSP